jgi:hypothetical protein
MSMAIEAFLSDLRTAPGFVAAAASDPKCLAELERVERGLSAVDRLANNDPAIVDIFDRIQAVAGNSNLSLKERLLAVGKLLAEVQAAGRVIH